MGRHHAFGGCRRLVYRGRANNRHSHAHPCQPSALAGVARKYGCGCQCLCATDAHRRQLGRFRCGRASLPGFAAVREWVLSIEGGPLVSLAIATNVLAALTGSASGGMAIALDALGSTYMRLAAEHGIDPGLMHRVAVIGSGTLDTLPHNGAVVTLLAVCGTTHRESYLDIVMVAIVSAILALVVVIALGSVFGSF